MVYMICLKKFHLNIKTLLVLINYSNIKLNCRNFIIITRSCKKNQISKTRCSIIYVYGVNYHNRGFGQNFCPREFEMTVDKNINPKFSTFIPFK